MLVVNTYAKSTDAYFAQRIMGASPEQQAALLMEAGQLFLGKAIKAVNENNHSEAARCYIRVSEIINESICRLNQEDGGELALNLFKLYNWWTSEIYEASRLKDTVRLGAVATYMGEIRQAWEQLHEKQTRGLQTSEFEVGDRVV